MWSKINLFHLVSNIRRLVLHDHDPSPFFFSSWVFMTGRLGAVIPVLYTTWHRPAVRSQRPWLDVDIAAMLSSAPSRKWHLRHQGIHSQSGRSNCDHKFVYLCVNHWDLTFKQCHFFYSSCGEIEYVLSDLNREAATLMKYSVSPKMFFLIKINSHFDVNFSSV